MNRKNISKSFHKKFEDAICQSRDIQGSRDQSGSITTAVLSGQDNISYQVSEMADVFVPLSLSKLYQLETVGGALLIPE